jgi:hypothetical protein
MADENGGGISALLGAVLGAALIAVVALSFAILSGHVPTQTVQIEAPESPGAG